MKRRFSSEELFELRNHIPIDDLIKNHLVIPSKMSNGYFRFLCPICNKFQTATNPKTNLARCFLCKRNFNTIDMVMICRKTSFVEGVKALIKIRQNLTEQNAECCSPKQRQLISTPEAIGTILKNTMAKERQCEEN